MAVLVVGCGSLGSLYASALTRVTEVWAYDASQAHVDAINANGLRLSGMEEFTAPVKATADPAALADVPIDFVIVAVKGHYTRDAIRAIAPHLKGAAVLSVQNGIGHEETISEEIDSPVLQGVSLMAAEVVEPGHVQKNLGGLTYIGPFISPIGPMATTERAEVIAATMNAASLETEALTDVRGAVWSKLIMNSTLLPIRLLSQQDSYGMATFEPVRSLIEEVAAEGKAVAEKLGLTLIFDPLYVVEKAKQEGKSRHRGSMSHDMDRGVKTEIDFLIGAMVAEGEKLGLPMPTSRAVYQLFQGFEAARRKT